MTRRGAPKLQVGKKSESIGASYADLWNVQSRVHVKYDFINISELEQPFGMGFHKSGLNQATGH